MSTYTVKTILHGYHVYQIVWEAAVGQVLPGIKLSCVPRLDVVSHSHPLTPVGEGLAVRD